MHPPAEVRLLRQGPACLAPHPSRPLLLVDGVVLEPVLAGAVDLRADETATKVRTRAAEIGRRLLAGLNDAEHLRDQTLIEECIELIQVVAALRTILAAGRGDEAARFVAIASLCYPDVDVPLIKSSWGHCLAFRRTVRRNTRTKKAARKAAVRSAKSSVSSLGLYLSRA